MSCEEDDDGVGSSLTLKREDEDRTGGWCKRTGGADMGSFFVKEVEEGAVALILREELDGSVI